MKPTPTTKPAFVHQCKGCEGKGDIKFGKHRVHCVGCNGYGWKLEIVTKEKMRAYCSKE
jgi:ssDNA-binding Zn-finger/Zn-ribbon topoisomerase 1